VAGPWVGDEIGELLYWIPFLRYVQTATSRERLWVVTRPENPAWYEGIGAPLVSVEDYDGDPQRLRAHLSDVLGPDGYRLLPPDSVASIRLRLLQGDPDRRKLHRALDRVLEFAALVAPELPDGYELPDDFVAVRFSDSDLNAAELVEPLLRSGTVVLLDPPGPLVASDRLQVFEGVNREAEAAILARARGFLGGYGPSPYVAALLGVPSFAVYARRDEVADEDLELAASFLDREPFGRLQMLESTTAAETIAALLYDRAGSLSLA
jgi:hypothetical protein